MVSGNVAPPFEQVAVPPSENSGIVLLYDTLTGVPSRVLRYLVPGTLRKKRADGSPVFAVAPPANVPARGQHKCMLHDTNPNRGAYDAMGLPSCRKNNLPNLFQVEQHMAHRHRVEWATIQRLEEREAAEAQRSYQRTIQETLMAGMDKNLHHETCPDCGQDFTATVKVAAMQKRDGHRRAEHGWQGKFAGVPGISEAMNG